MQVIGIGCVCGGGGGGGKKNHIYFTEYPQCTHLHFLAFWQKIHCSQKKKKKTHCTTRTIIYCTHRRRRGDGCRGRHPALSLREVQGPRAAVTPARFDVRTSHCLSTSESKWGKETEPIALNRIWSFLMAARWCPLPYPIHPFILIPSNTTAVHFEICH